jgi:hypothetical protein
MIHRIRIIPNLDGRSDRFPCCPGKKAGAEAQKAGRNLLSCPFFVSAKRRGGKGITGLKRRKPAFRKEELPPFLARRMIFCPGMGPLGNTWFSLFAEPTDNKNFSERKQVSFSAKLEMILA